MSPRCSCLVAGVICLALLSACGQGLADQPIKAPEWAPKYTLTTPQMKSDRIASSIKYLSFSFRRISSGRGEHVTLKARGPSGEIDISGVTFAFDKDSGEISLSPRMGIGFLAHESTPDMEFYLVASANMAGNNYGEFLVSNVVSIGKPGPATTAREWNNEEQAAYEKDKLAAVPPASIAPGHQAVTPGDKLVPGMPIKVGYYGDWVDGEVIANKNDGQVGVKVGPTGFIRYFSRDKWLAAHPDVLARAAANPSEFSPSVRVLPGSLRELPGDGVAIDSGLKIPPGTPLLSYFGRWKRVIAVRDQGDSIVVHHPGRPAFADRPESRDKLAIQKDTLARLGQPGAAEEFASNLDELEADRSGRMRTGISRGRSDEFNDATDDSDAFNDEDNLDDFHIIERSHPIRASIPKRAVKLPTDITLPAGTLVAYSRLTRWQAAKVVRDEGDSVIIRDDDAITRFAERVPRDQLIIQTKTLSKLKRTATTTAADLSKTLRTWTDSSGKHKIEARFVGVADGKVTLKTDAGREIVLPVAKLSDEDQALVARVGETTKNPFE
ncbi:MAG: SHD1 domain-containing protein [Planctomycetota bacterium]